MCFFSPAFLPELLEGNITSMGRPQIFPNYLGFNGFKIFPRKPHWFPLVLPTCPPTIARQHGAVGTDRDAGSWSHRLLQMFKTPRFWASLAWVHLYPTVIEYLLSSFIIIHHHSSSFFIIHHYSSSFIIIHHHSSSIRHHSSSSVIIRHHSSSFIIMHHHSSSSSSS